MKVTKSHLKRAIKEELQAIITEISQGEDSALGTAGTRSHMEVAIYKALRDGRHFDENNPLSLSALFDSSNGAVLRHLGELGLDDQGVKQAMGYARQYSRLDRPQQIHLPDGDLVQLIPAQVRAGDAAGERGLYLK